MFFFKAYKFLLILITIFWCSILKAQVSNTSARLPIQLTIPAKASISLAGSDLNFSFTPSNESNQQTISPKSAGKIWINYSSIIDFNSTNSIYVNLGTGNLPAEISIKLSIGQDAGFGSGQVGIPKEPIILSSSPQPIITNIGSCYTGKGVEKGHMLSYSWELAPNYDPDLIRIEDLQIEVGIIYTIVNN